MMPLQIDDRTGAGPVELLLAAGADPNRRNSSGVPVFFAAAGNGSPETTLALLLTNGADLRATASHGETILFYAATASNWRAVRRLLEREADWHQGRSFKGLTLLELVDEVARERQSLQTDDGQLRDDDGFPDVVAFLRGQHHAR